MTPCSPKIPTYRTLPKVIQPPGSSPSIFIPFFTKNFTEVKNPEEEKE